MRNNTNERYELAMRMLGKRWNGLILSLLMNISARPIEIHYENREVVPYFSADLKTSSHKKVSKK